MVKCLPEYFYCVNIIFKIRRSKVTDYAALTDYYFQQLSLIHTPKVPDQCKRDLTWNSNIKLFACIK